MRYRRKQREEEWGKVVEGGRKGNKGGGGKLNIGVEMGSREKEQVRREE